ncbi:MAG TPA: DUF222 domain-containing protein [Acidimicrobiales bacterium]|nr:DUF222 domain-containing protein [Acidimicrobiales bacterium]
MGSVGSLREVVDELVASSPSALAEADIVVDLHRQLTRLTAVMTEAMAAFEARGTWRDEGARSAAAMLSVRCRAPRSEVQCRLHLGRACRSLPAATAAWRAGDIGEPQVQLLARARNDRTTDKLDADEEMLVDQAGRLRFDQFRNVVAYWLQRADPDGTERGADDQRARRRLHLSRSLDGAWFGDFLLDPISGAAVSGRLRLIEHELFEADWRIATERVGHGDVTVNDLDRTPAQRRADALVEMARRSGTAPADGRRPKPLFTVLVDYPTFADRVCELADGTVVTTGSLVRWLDDAWVERVVFDGAHRVLDVGVARRLFEGGTRRAVQVRDRECFHPYCDRPADECQVDHIQPWAHDGPTTQANGRLACGPHNRGRHRRRPPQPDG